MILFDLETYRIPNAADFLEPIPKPEPTKPNGRLKDPKAIEDDLKRVAEKDAAQLADWAKAQQKQLDDCALDPTLARIVALGTMWPGDEIVTVKLAKTEAQEAEMLREFASVVEDPATQRVLPLVGYNSRGFDLPMLQMRALLLGVPFPKLNTDRFKSPHPDVMIEIFGHDNRRWKSLRWMAKRMGYQTDDAFSGAEIAQLVESNNWAAVEKHCESDVLQCRFLAEKLKIVRAPVRAVA